MIVVKLLNVIKIEFKRCYPRKYNFDMQYTKETLADQQKN